MRTVDPIDHAAIMALRKIVTDRRAVSDRYVAAVRDVPGLVPRATVKEGIHERYAILQTKANAHA